MIVLKVLLFQVLVVSLIDLNDLKTYTGSKYVIAVVNGTVHYMLLKLADVNVNDEVIIPVLVLWQPQMLLNTVVLYLISLIMNMTH